MESFFISLSSDIPIHLWDDQYNWEVGDVLRKMSQVSFPLTLFIYWYWPYCWVVGISSFTSHNFQSHRLLCCSHYTARCLVSGVESCCVVHTAWPGGGREVRHYNTLAGRNPWRASLVSFSTLLWYEVLDPLSLSPRHIQAVYRSFILILKHCRTANSPVSTYMDYLWCGGSTTAVFCVERAPPTWATPCTGFPHSCLALSLVFALLRSQ